MSCANRVRMRLRHMSTVRGFTLIVMLTAAWCALWQEVTAANIAGGILVSVAVLATGVGTSARGTLRPGALLQLLWLVLVDLVTSAVDVAKEILTPGDNTNEAIVALNIEENGRHHLLLLIIAITVTPGTAVVDADPDTGTLYLHLLHAERRDEVAAHVRKLTELACDALPVPSEVRPLEVSR